MIKNTKLHLLLFHIVNPILGLHGLTDLNYSSLIF